MPDRLPNTNDRVRVIATGEFGTIDETGVPHRLGDTGSWQLFVRLDAVGIGPKWRGWFRADELEVVERRPAGAALEDGPPELNPLRKVETEVGGVIERLLNRAGRQDILDADIVHRATAPPIVGRRKGLEGTGVVVVHKYVTSRDALDRIEAEWRPSLGGNTINRAERIERTPDRLKIENEKGALLVVSVRS